MANLFMFVGQICVVFLAIFIVLVLIASYVFSELDNQEKFYYKKFKN